MTARPSAWMLLLVFAFPRSAAGQGLPLAPPDSLHAFLTISTSPESAWVMLDTTFAGRTPLSITVAAPARYHIRIQSPDVSNWLSGTIDDTIEVRGGQTVRRTFALETWTLLVTSPMGAEIFAGDSVLGTTPFIVHPGRLARTTPLTFRLKGYETGTADLDMAEEGILRVPLRARPDMEAPIEGAGIEEPPPSHLRLYLTGSGAVLAGAAAAYFKVKADNSNNDYLLTGNTSFSSDQKRFDTTSGVFLAVSEISLVLFLTFLMSE